MWKDLTVTCVREDSSTSQAITLMDVGSATALASLLNVPVCPGESNRFVTKIVMTIYDSFD